VFSFFPAHKSLPFSAIRLSAGEKVSGMFFAGKLRSYGKISVYRPNIGHREVQRQTTVIGDEDGCSTAWLRQEGSVRPRYWLEIRFRNQLVRLVNRRLIRHI